MCYCKIVLIFTAKENNTQFKVIVICIIVLGYDLNLFVTIYKWFGISYNSSSLISGEKPIL